MAIFKCKMCGGDLDIQDGLTVCECDYCGTKQTIPALDNEKKLNLFNRANRLRLNSEFDKAASIYENIIAEFPEEAEGYWGLVLCNYGIEYVDDPATARKIPTCHRAAFESVTKDENYEMALEYADVVSQKVYRDEAREIDRIMSEILSISKNEKPYDIFICYKETDAAGGRTIDSVIAQDVYDALTDKGYRVFFSRISLEDKLGKQYEPIIFAALNSAKVMLAFGTKYEYYQAVWVKNEWSRFLKLMAKDKSKTLVPCYKDMDAYDMPDEFKALQAQDMGKVGAIQDLLRGIEKLLGKETMVKTAVVSTADGSALITRGYIYLEDKDFKKADSYFDRALDENPMDSKAYIGKVLSVLKLSSLDEIDNIEVDLNTFKDFNRALRFATGQEKCVLEEIKERAEKKRLYKTLIAAFKKIANKKADLEKKEKEAKLKVEKEVERLRKEAEREQREAEKLRREAEERPFIIEAGVLKKYCGYSTDVTIPDGVIKIGENCFRESKIKSVALPSSVTSIAGYAFFRCTNLTSITIPNSVTNIGKCAFYGCINLGFVELSNAVTTIADSVFCECTNLSSIKISDNVTSIGDKAFFRCANLSSIIIPSNVKTIGMSAFFCCTKLDSVTIVNSSTKIGKEAFSGTPYYKQVLSDERRMDEEERCQQDYRSKGLCQHCGGEFKGLFGKKCARCGKPKDY